MHCAYITRIKGIRKHSNADRLNVGSCFGNNVIVGLTTEENELGIYFPTDMRLGIEYCEANNLLIKKDENGVNVGGYLEPDRRHVSTLKLRGEKSDGLFMPLTSLEKFTDISKLTEGDVITTLNGILICEKYIPKTKKPSVSGTGKKTGKKSEAKEKFPFFEEHIDTSQLAYNMHEFKEGDLCYITLKMHGTSARTAYTIVDETKRIPAWLYPIYRLFGKTANSKRKWDSVSGTRRVVLRDYDGGFYGSNAFRKKWHDLFANRLQKGETVYYEIVGYTDDGGMIMPDANNKKTNDKEFIKQYGDTTKFTYGCEAGKNNIYVYRMTMTNEDGDVVEYPWHLVKARCEQMGINHVPELDKFIYTTQEDLQARVEKLTEGVDPVGKTHLREGIVVRIEDRIRFSAFKNKSFYFKVLESIIKLDDILDIEEEQSIISEEINK